MSFSVTNPYPVFLSQTGGGLNAGQVYIGTANQDPETNPIPVYWDEALTIPATQPLPTIGGYIYRNGTPAQAYVSAQTYSIRVRDRFNQQVFYNAEANDLLSSIYAALASTVDPSGASLIGNLGGGTVQDAIFVKGRQTPIAASKAAVKWIRDDPVYPLEDYGGLWGGAQVWWHGLNRVFNASDGSSANGPSSTLTVWARNQGSPSDICGAVIAATADADDVTVFGANILALSTGKDNVKLVGLEIDVEPSAGDTNLQSGSGGIFVNMFSVANPGPVMLTGAIAGGTWGNGIVLGGLAATAAGLSIAVGQQAASLVNTSVGTFTGTAITLGSGRSRGVLFEGTGTSSIYGDGTNVLNVLPAAGSWVWRDNANLASLVNIIDSGNGGVIDIDGTSPQYQVNGTKVVGARDTGWTAMTGSPDKSSAYNTATVTLQQLAGRVAFLQAALAAHGLIGP